MKKILMPILVAGALVLPAACGSEQAATDSKPSTPAAVGLSQADFAPKIQAAMLAKGTFRTVSVSDDEGDKTTYTTDVKYSTDGSELSGKSDGTGEDALSLVRAGGQVYVKTPKLSKNEAQPWAKADLKSTDPKVILNGVLIRLAQMQFMTHDLIGGAPYATGFSSEPAGEATVYTMKVSLSKAAAANALGAYLTADVASGLEGKALTINVTVGKDLLPTTIALKDDDAKVVTSFSKYGDPVTVKAPAAAEVA
ncbi:hypothetical protein E1263_26260 [Kribbella antibiotica]|uniref:LppX_LprAFG lipoprotein n=1 Tax=Kribbella antibiotica TaxID=190195 RepID=A0A4R4ZDC5_9ACTN|nr:hypothetical protein [Kribbella antibiotica]TDD55279.1 hypothetical protein E1263_26260 [Kribbella antibiotica]